MTRRRNSVETGFRELAAQVAAAELSPVEAALIEMCDRVAALQDRVTLLQAQGELQQKRIAALERDNAALRDRPARPRTDGRRDAAILTSYRPTA